MPSPKYFALTPTQDICGLQALIRSNDNTQQNKRKKIVNRPEYAAPKLREARNYRGLVDTRGPKPRRRGHKTARMRRPAPTDETKPHNRDTDRVDLETLNKANFRRLV